MQNFMKSAFIAFGMMVATVAAAQAGTVYLTINNSSTKTITIDAVPVCTGCTTSSASSISAGGSDTSEATSNPGVSSFTYRTDYSTYWGAVEKGCRASITVEVSAVGAITRVITRSWNAYTGSLSCTTTSTPVISGGDVYWGVRYNAS